MGVQVQPARRGDEEQRCRSDRVYGLPRRHWHPWQSRSVNLGATLPPFRVMISSSVLCSTHYFFSPTVSPIMFSAFTDVAGGRIRPTSQRRHRCMCCQRPQICSTSILSPLRHWLAWLANDLKMPRLPETITERYGILEPSTGGPGHDAVKSNAVRPAPCAPPEALPPFFSARQHKISPASRIRNVFFAIIGRFSSESIPLFPLPPPPLPSFDPFHPPLPLFLPLSPSLRLPSTWLLLYPG